jgi:ribosomal-protein-alanine N-acetyltransferase
MELETPRLRLVLQTREEVEHSIDAMPESDRAQVSPDWLARMRTAQAGDPWAFAFRVMRRDSGSAIGMCSFKGPPVEGIVEIAYAIDPDHRRNGFATEAAQGLFDYAASRGDVRIVRAHTLPDGTASKGVLAKCDFRYLGETIDPEDGTVSRFERETKA